MAVEYRQPWCEIGDDKWRAGLQGQYDLEISPQHPLWGEKGRIVGKNEGTDDVLVQLAGGRYAIVHLVWSNNPGDVIHPSAVVYPSDAEASAAIAADADDFDS
ncbi:MAG: hypothetical protein KJ670_08775 [Alphaproteobacteria bacterium]|nr:hypothetical protein [Rhizobiaceae bacterium]MBU3962902.1 hypothetical protein [Alphaproteobacteria bacterium]MBU4049264.1 hypothetical protein [Alphaproteobacteria bacterium]MBU4088799.1 hypothetical protein [Alphaproteobacteria bacterium]MBU4154571.1 hypothetical protein [Alphaproteobacteria bacterium]